jgi:hypothetical protein
VRRWRSILAAVALAATALAGCDGSPWLGLSPTERDAAMAFDNDRAQAVCERNLREVAGHQGLSRGLSTPSRNSYGGFVMAVSFWRTTGLLQTEHQCLIDPVTYAVTEWRTPMQGAERIL